MKINDHLKNTVTKNVSKKLLSNFLEVANEMNFEDHMGFRVFFCSTKSFYLKFNNRWALTVYDNDTYSLCLDLEKRHKIEKCNYKELLKFMDDKGIKAGEQCDYKDAELYIINFNN